MIKVYVVKDYEEASDRAFEVMKEYLVAGNTLGLATGSSPLGLYERMVEDHKKNGTDYSRITTFNLDEYVGLPTTHPQSYYAFMHDNLFEGVEIPEENTHIPSGFGDLKKNCRDYDEMIRNNPIDIQLLGIGSNGHIGFNEPGTSFEIGTHVTDLKESTRKDNARFFDPLGEEVPKQALTMGLKTIMSAKKILLIAMGEKKQKPIKELIEGKISEDVPATILQKHRDVVVIIDKEAAGLLGKDK